MVTTEKSSKIPPKIGVHTMMWGKRLTKDRLIQMLRDIGEVAWSFGYQKVGIEFGQKIHHLGSQVSQRFC